jgi:hypothetical protein
LQSVNRVNAEVCERQGNLAGATAIESRCCPSWCLKRHQFSDRAVVCPAWKPAAKPSPATERDAVGTKSLFLVFSPQKQMLPGSFVPDMWRFRYSKSDRIPLVKTQTFWDGDFL